MKGMTIAAFVLFATLSYCVSEFPLTTGDYDEEVFFKTDLPYDFNIYHMEEDLYVPNSIILTYLHSVQSYDGNALANIAGKATESGYQDGEGEAARLYDVRHFTQLNDTQLLVLDYPRYGNHRLRLIDRVTRATSRFSSSILNENGNSMSSSKDGKFFKDLKDSNQVLAIDGSQDILYAIDIDYKNISVFASWTGGYNIQIISFTQQKDSGNIYVLVIYGSYYHMGYIDYRSRIWSLYPRCGSSEGPLSSVVDCYFYGYHPFIFMSSDMILLGDNINNMHSIDVITNTTKELSLAQNWHKIYSALVVGNTLYTGGEHGTVYSYTSTSSDISALDSSPLFPLLISGSAAAGGLLIIAVAVVVRCVLTQKERAKRRAMAAKITYPQRKQGKPHESNPGQSDNV